MLVSAVTSLSTRRGGQSSFENSGHAQSKNSFERLNYFGAKKEINTQLVKEDMFHKIALWKEFCEKQIINDESQVESFNYLA